jgi:hypothetical protein
MRIGLEDSGIIKIAEGAVVFRRIKAICICLWNPFSRHLIPLRATGNAFQNIW